MKQVNVNFPFTNILTLIFITLKLTHYIDWSWWWVLSPILFPLGLAGGFLVFLGIVAIIE